MKDQYFGDINDYRKYGLLRTLARSSGLSIGMCWLLTSDDERNDGEFRNYLANPQRWRRHDPELYDRLQRLIEPRVGRAVRYAREWDLIPSATYFEKVLTDRVNERDAYFAAAWSALRTSDLLFFDPDNGIEVQSRSRGARGSAKYVYWNELRQAYGNGQSLLIYQHFPRVQRDRFVPFLATRIADEVGTRQVIAFTTSHVAFFLVPQPAHVEVLSRAAAETNFAWLEQIKLWAPNTTALLNEDLR